MSLTGHAVIDQAKVLAKSSSAAFSMPSSVRRQRLLVADAVEESAACRASAAQQLASSKRRRRAIGKRRDSRACRHRSTATCSSTANGEYCGCLSSSVRRSPRASSRCVEASRSEPNFAKAAISRYCASSPLIGPATCLHRLDLRRRTHARHRDADVHRRTDALVEQIGLQEDLAVGDRDHVGRNVGRDVVGLGLDDRQARSASRRHCRRSASRRARAGGSADRRRRPDRLRGPAGGAAAATSGDRRRPAWKDRHR